MYSKYTSYYYNVFAFCAVLHILYRTITSVCTINTPSSDVLDGARDSIGYDSVLAESLSVSITDNGTLRLIVFSGAYSDSHYTEVSGL